MRHSLSVLLLLASPLPVLAQTTWHVDASACDGAGTGAPDDPFCRIQEAVDAASSGDTVLVGAGTYVENVVLPARALTLRAASASIPPEIHAAGGPALSLAPGADVRLEGLTLSGAGIRCDQSTLKVVACRFLDVQQYMGGGIWATESELDVRGCRFDVTRSGLVGGAISAIGCDLRVVDSDFVGDPTWFSTYAGGALWLEQSDSLVSGCTFVDHQVRNSGSAIQVAGGRLMLERSTFRENLTFEYAGTVAILEADAEIRACVFQANESDLGWGGALYVSNGPAFDVLVGDSVFERNRAAEGGAVCVHAGFVELEGCRFSANSAAASHFSEHGYGGALLVGGLGPPGAAFAHARRCAFLGNSAFGHAFHGDGRGGAVHGPVQLENCTLYKNQVGGFFGDGPFGAAASGGASLRNSIVWASGDLALEAGTSVEWSLVQGGWPGTGNLEHDPRFVDREAGDLHLLPASPCIDAGSPDEYDADGSRVDLGAFPYEPVRAAFARRPGR